MEPISILVIDDEPMICKGCRMVLSDKGHTVGTCMSGKLGLDAIRKELFDAIILDLKLPDMDGMDILRTVRKEKPGIYVIVMTGYSTVHTAVKAMKLGAFDYLGKPFSDDELVIAVERAIEKKHLVEENLVLRKGIIDRFGFHNIVGKNPKILRIFDQIAKVSPAESTVLIYG